MPNTVQLTQNNIPVYPITDVSLILGLTAINNLLNYYTKSEVEQMLQSYKIAWDGNSEPDITKIPAGVTVTYNTVDYEGTLVASNATLGTIYLVSDGAGEYDRYITSYDGTNYTWAPLGSTAISLEDYATKADLNQLDQKVEKQVIPIIETGHYINLSGGVGSTVPSSSSASASYDWHKISLSAGDIVIINGKGGSQPRLWAFVDAEDKILAVADIDILATNLQLTAPTGSSYVIINDKNDATSYLVKKDTVPYQFLAVDNEVAQLNTNIESVVVGDNALDDLVLVQDGATVKATDGTITISQYTTDYKVMSLDVRGKILVKINIDYSGTGWSIAAGYDSNGNFVKSFATAVTNGSPMQVSCVIDESITLLKLTVPKKQARAVNYSINSFAYGDLLKMVEQRTAAKTIHVAPDATGDNSLVGVLKALMTDTSTSKPSKDCRYEIILEAGDYDMDCSDQVATLGRGVFVPPYVTIRGAGRGVTFLKYIYEGTDDTVMRDHSALNMPYTSVLEGVTVEVENIRYAIHSDLPETGRNDEWYYSVVELRNVELIHHGITNGETPTTNNPSAWGGGSMTGQIRRFVNCRFVADTWSPFANHDRDTATAAQYFEFVNCEFIANFDGTDMASGYDKPAVLLNSWGSGVPVFVNFVNCYANKWVELYTTGNFDSDYQVKSDNELLFHIKENTANPQNKRHYVTGGCREFVFPESTSKGTPVVITNSRAARAATASDARALIYGILLHDVAAGGVGVVMRSGMFAVQQIIGSSFSAGDTIGWDGSTWDEVESDPIAVLLTDKIAILRV